MAGRGPAAPFGPAVVFDAAADSYDDDQQHAYLADQLVAGIQLAEPPVVVIDVATGSGAAAFSALRRLAPSRVVGLDISARMLDRARAKAVRHDPAGRIEWRAAPAVPLGADSASADLVLCSSSLHFLGRAAVVEWRRVLHPGGWLAFSLPHAADVRVALSAVVAEDHPRRAFLVWAQAPRQR